jgi:hypothetical protein
MKMCAPHEGEYTDAMAIADIKSAIEKATKDYDKLHAQFVEMRERWERRTDYCHELERKLRESRAAHASEQGADNLGDLGKRTLERIFDHSESPNDSLNIIQDALVAAYSKGYELAFKTNRAISQRPTPATASEHQTKHSKHPVSLCKTLGHEPAHASEPSSGGQEWMVIASDGGGYSLVQGETEIAWFRPPDIDDAENIKHAHNATLQPQSDDTKRLDCLQKYALPDESGHIINYRAVADAFLAKDAMSQTKEKE